MNKRLIIGFFLFITLLTGCGKEQTIQQESVQEVFNTEVLNNDESIAVPTIEESKSSSNVGAIELKEWTTEAETEVPSSLSVDSELEEESESEENPITVDADMDSEALPESQQLYLDGLGAVSFENDTWTYEIKDSDEFKIVDAFQEVTFFGEGKQNQYPGTVNTMTKFGPYLKKLIVLFYREKVQSSSLELGYSSVGVKTDSAEEYKEKMDIFEQGKQRIRVEIFLDKLNNKDLTISFSVIPGTEGETIEGS